MPLSVDQIAAKANDIATSTLVPMRQQKNYAVALLELVNRRISPDDAVAVFIHLTISAFGRKDKSDIVLASWGLIRGYESKDLIVKERRLKYIEDSGYKSSTDNLAKEEIKYCGYPFSSAEQKSQQLRPGAPEDGDQSHGG